MVLATCFQVLEKNEVREKVWLSYPCTTLYTPVNNSFFLTDEDVRSITNRVSLAGDVTNLLIASQHYLCETTLSEAHSTRHVIMKIASGFNIRKIKQGPRRAAIFIFESVNYRRTYNRR